MPANDVRKMVILHVEESLLINKTQINELLLDTLRSNGVNEIYLFTNRSLTDVTSCGLEDAPPNLVDIIEYLHTKMFSVKRVITLADPHWFGNTSIPYKKLYEPLIKKRKNAVKPLDLKDCSPETLEYLYAKLEWDTATVDLLKSNELAANSSKFIISQRLDLCLIDRQTDKPVQPLQFFPDYMEAMRFFSDEENRKKYYLILEFNPAYTSKLIKGEFTATDPDTEMLFDFMKFLPSSEPCEVYYFNGVNKSDKDLTKLRKVFPHVEFNNFVVDNHFVQTREASQKEKYLRFLKIDPVNSLMPMSHTHAKPHDEEISSCFLIRIFAHPATIPALLILLGLGLGAAGLGVIPGLALGLTPLMSQIVTGVGGGTAVVGVGLGIYRFFTASKEAPDDAVFQQGDEMAFI